VAAVRGGGAWLACLWGALGWLWEMVSGVEGVLRETHGKSDRRQTLQKSAFRYRRALEKPAIRHGTLEHTVSQSNGPAVEPGTSEP